MAGTRAEEVKEALIAAVVRLMDERSVADISVKDIAAEAQVNHGLVHRHFGSKEQLVREAVTRTNALVHQGRPATGRTLWFYELLRHRPEIARIVARCCLDGPRDLLPLAAVPAEALEHFVEPIRGGLERLGLDQTLDPHVINAICVSAVLGWIVFRPLLDEGFGLPVEADDVAAELARLIDAVVDVPAEQA